MPKISVLMSVYNESLEYVQQSVSSIINQTFKDFELIIVNDNPDHNKRVVDYLEQQKEKDKRIKIINNKKNLGLAESMNVAFKYSSGKYLARMDGDDISHPNRFEKEISQLDSGKFDIVCSYYETINEKSELVNRYFQKFNNDNIVKYLPYTNTIHHPTVMMTRDIFIKAGQYRIFPCAQDYDLWLRFLNINAKFCIVKEKLLKYRIREDSVTRKKHFIQKLTIMYIQKLYKMRKKYGYDDYSLENYNKFLSNNHMNNEEYILRCVQEKKLNDQYVKLKNNGNFNKYLYKIKIFFKSDFYRKIFFSNFVNLLTIYYENLLKIINFNE